MNKKCLTILSLIAFFCSACASTAEQENKAHHTKEAISDATKSCKENGGEVKKAGIKQMPHCVITYPDAGKPCKNISECTGSCLLIEKIIPAGMPVVGECQHNNLVFGCYAEVEDGIAGAAICVD